ncbi:MAG: RNA-binding S4 domain-containing protein [Gammaproteobacteria bacterium]|nr:RNA-binding S4 domain-containing protein [Gammaproteobacteria bacterium]MBT8111603.1 RNA-binding S4 domain-containing protein [Gammaproteobacteria bacterium]NND48385.1 RNA-binding S4 domain-containing protein [Woeseiaceae bacterium]NNL46301.1 RNA-binding S4 domain-containing protein [Woeseiaceae bacterium]
MSNDSLRLDRWLWFTRFYKTRMAASAAVHGGHVRVNGERARAATSIRIGDEVQLVRQQLTYELTVRGVPARRGPAKEAQACYDESPASIARRQQRLAELRRDRLQMPMTKGKPDKHTRRQLRNRKGR